MYTLVRTFAVRLLICIIIVLPDSDNSCMNGKQIIQKNSSPVSEANFMLSLEMGSKAVLCCSAVPLTNSVLVTWKITLRGQPTCTRSYKKEKNETSSNCTDDGIMWVSKPGLSPQLQINAVAVTHDGNYTCETATYDGFFQRSYQLHVLVRPEANIFLSKHQTVVCEAVAGRPAAQISWVPAGHCVTTKEEHSNGTVTVRSVCSYPASDVSIAACLVSHSTGNRSLSEDFLHFDSRSPASSLLIILYVKLSVFVVVLVMVGFSLYQKINANSMTSDSPAANLPISY